MKPVIKKKINKLKIAATAVMLVAVTFSLPITQVASSVTADFKQEAKVNAQILNAFEDLNCDTSYLSKKSVLGKDFIKRQPHNEDKPIYVTISKEYSNETKQQVKESLDYVFGVVGSINEKYTYEIVDVAPEGLNSISYEVKDLKLMELISGQDEVLGMEDSQDYNNDGCNDKNIIYLDDDYVNVEDDKKLYVLKHELLHVFGFEDVYYDGMFGDFKGVIKANTFMNSSNYSYNYNLRGTNLTPNDFKCLLALYSPKAETQEEYNKLIESAKLKIKEFEQEYYANQVERLNAVYKHGYERLAVDDDFAFEISNYRSESNNLKVVVKGDAYKIYYYDKNRKIKESLTGNVSYVDGCAVLHNVKLFDVKKDGKIYQYVGDFMVSYGKNDKFNKLYVFDFVADEIGKGSLIYGMENDLQLNP